MSLTEPTELTEFFRQRLKDRWLTLRVPSGFDLSPTDYTDFFTRLLLRRHSISKLSSALSYRNNCSDSFFLFFSIRSFLALPKTLLPSVVIIASFCIVQASLTLPSLIAISVSTDLHRCYSLCSLFGRSRRICSSHGFFNKIIAVLGN